MGRRRDRGASRRPPDLHILGAGEDNGARLWVLDRESTRAVVLSGHQGPVPSLAFDADRRLVTLSLDGTARLWTIPLPELFDLAHAKSGRNLTPAEWKLFFGETPYQRLFCDLPEPQVGMAIFRLIKRLDAPIAECKNDLLGSNWTMKSRLRDG